RFPSSQFGWKRQFRRRGGGQPAIRRRGTHLRLTVEVRMPKEDVTHRIELLAPFEARAGVRLEALSAFFALDDDIHAVTELGGAHGADGHALEADVELELAIHDDAGRVVARVSELLDADTCFGFEPFELLESVLPTQTIGRLRLIPR